MWSMWSISVRSYFINKIEYIRMEAHKFASRFCSKKEKKYKAPVFSVTILFSRRITCNDLVVRRFGY